MDMAFIRQAERMFAQERPARLDHALLLAALAAQRRARAEPRIEVCVLPVDPAQAREDALVELVLGGPRWRQALSAQRGCFSRAEAGRRVNAP